MTFPRRFAIVAAAIALAPRVAAAKLVSMAPIPDDVAVFGAGGIQIGEVRVFSGPVDGAAFDADDDLIWFVSKGTLEVIDLRAPRRPAIVIAKGLPTASFQIAGWSHASFASDDTGVYPLLRLDKRSTVEAK